MINEKILNFLPHVNTFITYDEVTGQTVSINDVVQKLSPYNIHIILKQIALINNCLLVASKSQKQLYALQTMLDSQFLSDDLRKQLREAQTKIKPQPLVFHSQQQLIALRIALLSCPSIGGKEWNQDAIHSFGEACLMINSLAGESDLETEKTRSLIKSASILLPISEFPLDSDFTALTGRSKQLWLDLPNHPAWENEKDFVPIHQKFQDFYKISLEEFIVSLYYAVIKCAAFEVKSAIMV